MLTKYWVPIGLFALIVAYFTIRKIITSYVRSSEAGELRRKAALMHHNQSLLQAQQQKTNAKGIARKVEKVPVPDRVEASEPKPVKLMSEAEMNARSHEAAAATNYRHYRSAGQYFLEAGLTEPALAAYAKVLASDEILAICLQAKQYTFLAHYLADPYNAAYLLPKLPMHHIQALLNSIPLLPSTVQSLSLWMFHRKDVEFAGAILSKISTDRDLSMLYWSHINSAYTVQVVTLLAQRPQLVAKAVYTFHAELLSEMGRADDSQLFLTLEPSGNDRESDSP